MSEYTDLIEQYRKKLLESSSGTDFSMLYKNSADALIAAQNAAYQSRVAELEAELPKIEKTYDDARSKAYADARLSAAGDNEALAALGLAGNLNQAAVSGLSESSRIAADNALRQNINSLNESQINAELDVNNRISEASLEKDRETAEILSNYAAQLAEQRQNAISNALKELDAFGRIMTQESADALGLPIGTLSYTAQLAAEKASRRGRGGSSSKKSASFQNALEKAEQYLSTPTDTYYASYNAALHGINVSALPAYQANEYLKNQLRNRTITEKQSKTIKSILGI